MYETWPLREVRHRDRPEFYCGERRSAHLEAKYEQIVSAPEGEREIAQPERIGEKKEEPEVPNGAKAGKEARKPKRPRSPRSSLLLRGGVKLILAWESDAVIAGQGTTWASFSSTVWPKA